MVTRLKGSVTLQVTLNGHHTSVTLSDVHYSDSVTKNIISYGLLESKGCRLAYDAYGSRVIERASDAKLIFPVTMRNNVLFVSCEKNRERQERERALAYAVFTHNNTPNGTWIGDAA